MVEKEFFFTLNQNTEDLILVEMSLNVEQKWLYS